MSHMLHLSHAGLRYAPTDVLEQLDVTITRIWLRDTWGVWSQDHRRIFIASGLTPVQERCVLAHEVEHVLAEDAGCSDKAIAVRQEQRADVEAARKLIGISDLATVAQWASDVYTAAAELDVTERMLQVRLNDLKGEGWPWRDGSRIAG